MFPFTKTKDVPSIEAKLNKDGRVARVSAVDQFDGQDFMMGENGFKRSDISAYMHAESQKLKDAILARMQEVDLPEGYPADTPVSEIINQIIPKYCNTSASVREFIANIPDKSWDEYQKSLNSQVNNSESKIDFTNTSEPKAD